MISYLFIIHVYVNARFFIFLHILHVIIFHRPQWWIM